MRYVHAYWVTVILVVAALLTATNSYDDTDDHANGERSGMSLYIDYGTGCEYLGSWSALTPRMHMANGKAVHKCEEVTSGTR